MMKSIMFIGAEDDEPSSSPNNDEWEEAEEEVDGGTNTEDEDEGGVQQTISTNELISEVYKRYDFMLNNAGNAWYVMNKETGESLLPDGREVPNYRRFGEDKNKAYKLIIKKLKEEK